MNGFSLTLFFAALNILSPYVCAQSPSHPSTAATCRRFYGATRYGFRYLTVTIACDNVRFESGQSFEQVLQRLRIKDDVESKHHTFAELAGTIGSIELNGARGNITIGANALAAYPKLDEFKVSAATDNETSSQASDYLSISPTTFQKVPLLDALNISRYILANDDTVRAILSVKDRLNTLRIYNGVAMPNRNKNLLTEVVSKFTNLSSLTIVNIHKNEEFPTSTFQGSASKLKYVSVVNCKLTRVPSNMFRNMRRLYFLQMSSNRVTTIDAGAFDDTTDMEMVEFKTNEIRRLPNGLFRNTKKLTFVDFRGNPLENLTSGNFSHVNRPDKVTLLLG